MSRGGVAPPAGRVLLTTSNTGTRLAYCAECGTSVAAEPECENLAKAAQDHLRQYHAGAGETVWN